MTAETFSIGILAYGSLIDEPGIEISASCLKVLNDEIYTPFNVEYARSSRTRRGAPTLVPIEGEGKPVKAAIILVNASVSEATDMLWRRETGRVGKTDLTYTRPSSPGVNDVIVESHGNFHGVTVVLYTRIGINIIARDAKSLAELAIASARALSDGRDGISYLMAAKRNGIRTSLTDAYENEIKRQAGASSLEEALEKISKG